VQIVSGPDFEPIDYEKIRGMPKMWTGNFAGTFRLTEKKNGKKKQVGIRVWQTSVDDDELGRYRELGQILKSFNDELPDHIQFATVELFEPPNYGFEVKAGIQPVVKMDWVDGADLDVFIKDLLQSDDHTEQDKSEVLIKILDMVRELTRFLYDKGASHGDLSSGNLMIEQVSRSGLKLHIVDFDTFYTEQLRDFESKTRGHKDWQHPGHFDGTLDLSGPRADFFPSLLICITLGALAIDQGMPRTNGGRYGPAEPDGSGIIIEAKDLIDPENSAVISELREMNDPRIDSCLRDIDGWLGTSPQVEFPPSLKTDWSSESRSAGTAVSHRPISSRTTGRRQVSDSRVRFNRPDDVITHVKDKQPAIRWLLIDLNRNQDRLGSRYLEAIEGLIEHYGGVEKVENDLRCEYAFALKRAGKWDEAKSIAEQCHLDANIGFLLTQILSRRGVDDWDRIIEIADNVLESSPGNANMLTAKAEAQFKRGDYESLSEAYEDALIKSGRDPRVLLSLVWNANKWREFMTGVDAFFELLSIDEDGLLESGQGFKTGEIARVLKPGFECLNRAMQFDMMTIDDLMSFIVEINPEILMMETRTPNEHTRKSFVYCLGHLGNHALNWKDTPSSAFFRMPHTFRAFGAALCSLGTLGTGESINEMDRGLQDFFRKFNHEYHFADEGDDVSHPAFLSWDIVLPFCVEYPSGTWTKFAFLDSVDRTDMIHKPSGLD
jgi:tetratricopeptide (TPR) repeat protein